MCEQIRICLEKHLIQNALEETTKCYLTLGFGYIEKLCCFQPRKWNEQQELTQEVRGCSSHATD